MLPWWGVPIVTSKATRSPPKRRKYARATRPPMLCATSTTRLAPVAARISSIRAASCSAKQPDIGQGRPIVQGVHRRDAVPQKEAPQPEPHAVVYQDPVYQEHGSCGRCGLRIADEHPVQHHQRPRRRDRPDLGQEQTQHGSEIQAAFRRPRRAPDPRQREPNGNQCQRRREVGKRCAGDKPPCGRSVSDGVRCPRDIPGGAGDECNKKQQGGHGTARAGEV